VLRVLRTLGHQTNEVDYLATSRTDLLCLSKTAFIDAMDEYLEDEPEIRLTIAEGLWNDLVHKAELRLWGMRIACALPAPRPQGQMASPPPAPRRACAHTA
jgi:hypothetical protein